MLDVQHITKRYGDLIANDDVSLSINGGEIHALLGENGAGKSTLVKILYGAVRPDTGEIRWNGQPVRIDSPAAARALGVGMVFQHFSLFEALTVAENIALAADSPMEQMPDIVAEMSERYRLPIAPTALVAELSAGERQRVEILRCLTLDPKLIILDEPTSVLTPQEAEDLFTALRRFAEEGRAILYISHKLDEVRRLCHRATILRRGKVVASCDPREMTPSELAQAMVGAAPAEVRRNSAQTEASAAPALKVSDLSLAAPAPYATALKSISFEIRPGEVAAIAGVAGNGQSELFDALSGETPAPRPEAIEMLGTAAGRLNVTARRRLGAAFVSEERLGHGAAPDRRLSENLLLSRGPLEPDLVRSGWLNFTAATALVDRLSQTFDVRKSEPDPAARALSGGNLQKFLMGREIDRQPRLLIVNQPSWGVDAAAAADLRRALIALAANGAAVLAISQDLDEIFEIADRVAVLSEGRLSPFAPAAEVTRESVGLVMGGAATELKGAAHAL